MSPASRTIGVRESVVAFFIAYAALSVYWAETYRFYFFGADEWVVFVSFAKSETPLDLVKSILAPHNRHFAPVFKSIFFLEYSAFGVSSASPYHAVSMLIFTLSAMSLWRFLYSETGDRKAAFLGSAVFSLNSVYVTVISWVFLQQFLLSALFLLCSLNSAARNVGRRKYLVGSGIYGVLSAFSLSMGAVSVLFSAAYYLAKTKKDVRLASVRYCLPILAAGAAVLLGYLLAGPFFKADTSGALVFDPLMVAEGASVLVGNILLESAGFFYLANRLLSVLDIPFSPAVVAVFKAATHFAFLLFLLAALPVLRKSPGPGRAAVLFGCFMAVLSAALICVATVGYLGMDVYKVTDNYRYKMFPMLGIAVAFAGLASRMGGKAKAIVASLAVLFVPLHLLLIHQSYVANRARVETVKEIASDVVLSTRQQVGVLPSGEVFFIEAASGRSYRFADIKYPMLPDHHELLHLFKAPDEALVREGGGTIYLKNYVEVKPDNAESGLSPVKFSVARGGAQSIPLSTHSPVRSPYQHLYMKLKSDTATMGRLKYRDGNNVEASIDFAMEGSIFYRPYLVPCPFGQDLTLVLGEGDFSIKEMRFYY